MKCYFIHFISLQILDIDHWYAPPRFLIGSFTRFGIQSTNFVHVPSISSSWYQTWSMDSISFILVVHSLRRKRALMIAYKRSMKFKSGPWSIREQSSQVSDHACFNHVYNYLKSSCSPLGVESQRLRRRAAPDHCIFLGDSQSDRCGMDKAFRHCWRTSHVDCAGLAHTKKRLSSENNTFLQSSCPVSVFLRSLVVRAYASCPVSVLFHRSPGYSTNLDEPSAHDTGATPVLARSFCNSSLIFLGVAGGRGVNVLRQAVSQHTHKLGVNMWFIL